VGLCDDDHAWRHPIDPSHIRESSLLTQAAHPVLTGPSGAGDTGSGQDQLRRFFSALAAENFAALLAAMLIVSPVDGLRPSRAAR
jgi:hypothetical protein